MLQKLIHSRKFVTMLLDAAVSLILFFAVKYGAPSLVEDIKFVIGILQPVVAVVILGWAWEDAAVNGNPFQGETSELAQQ